MSETCFLIGHWAARRLEGQLHLTVMVALVPDHVLEQEDRVVVVEGSCPGVPPLCSLPRPAPPWRCR
jgi:hypothetical protein